MAKKSDDYSQLTTQQLEEYLKQSNLAKDEQEKLFNELTRRLTEELVSKVQGEKSVHAQPSSNTAEEERQESTISKPKKAKKIVQSTVSSSELSSDIEKNKPTPATKQTSKSDEGCGTLVGVWAVIIVVGYFLAQCTG